MKIDKIKFIVFFSVLFIVAAGSYFVGSAQNNSSKTVWQYSVKSVIRLGVREKYGESKSYNALFTVTAVSGKQYSAQTSSYNDNYGHVDFPQDFGMTEAVEGGYNWTCTVDGKIVASGNFDYIESENDAETRLPATNTSDSESKTGNKIGSGADDWWLWTKIKALIAKSAMLKDARISVDVINSEVILRGQVYSEAQKSKIEELVRSVGGVKVIINEIKVNAPK